ncbi:ATP-binding protein [Patescibacteria group bacterium]|nr:ATP-binding protein [Patescibacteria group bacterium]MCL5091300.1 ATP-binding protein [Patescibacteria group bacterium]
MKELNNPFSPGAGKKPPELAGRNANLERASIILQRFKAGRSDRSSIFTGLRGVGKTVLLNKINQMADEQKYYTFFIESPEDASLAKLIIPGLRKILLLMDSKEGAKEKIKIAANALRSFAAAFKIKIGEINIEVKGPAGIADSGNLDQDLVDLLVSVGEAATESNSAVAIFIDELQYVEKEELAALFAGLHRISQLQLPFVLFGAGLPQLAGLSGEAKSYAERLFEFQEIGALETKDAIKAIQDPLARENVIINTGALKILLRETEGYPYFLQEWGAHVWRTAKKSPINEDDVKTATRNAISTLDTGFFRVRFDRLTPIEKDYLRAMAELGKGPHRSGDIASKLGRAVEGVAPFRSNLITKGMIFSQQHGDTSFTVPKFDEYMRRVMPKFLPHPIRSRRRM